MDLYDTPLQVYGPPMHLTLRKIFGKNVTLWGHLGVPPRCSPRGRLGFAEGKADAHLVLCVHPSPRGFERLLRNLKVKHTSLLSQEI